MSISYIFVLYHVNDDILATFTQKYTHKTSIGYYVTSLPLDDATAGLCLTPAFDRARTNGDTVTRVFLAKEWSRKTTSLIQCLKSLLATFCYLLKYSNKESNKDNYQRKQINI